MCSGVSPIVYAPTSSIARYQDAIMWATVTVDTCAASG